MYDELTTDLRRAANTWLAEEYKVCAEAVRYLLKESADAIEELQADKAALNGASITNADRIRSMTDEELAEFIIGVLCYTKLPYMEVREKALRGNELLDWLREEASE